MDKARRNARWRERRRRKILDGECSRCPAPALPNRTKCEYHLAEEREANNARRAERDARGQCHQCDEPEAIGGLCGAHYARSRELAKGRMTALYHRRHAEGRCIEADCVKPHDGTHLRCRECADRVNARAAARYRERRELAERLAAMKETA